MARADKAGLRGVLVIDKIIGPTSMQVVANVRRRADHAKTGHAGTLDPRASGVLVLGIGAATRQLATITASDKAYETTIDLSVTNAAFDEELPDEPVDCPPATADQVADALGAFRGCFAQVPPAFSAVKIDGQRAYKAARSGAPVEPAPRDVVVHEIELMDFTWPVAMISVRCAKGFYVRALARDLGAALGTGGLCRSIRRTAVGPYTLEDAMLVDDLPEQLTQADLLDPR